MHNFHNIKKSDIACLVISLQDALMNYENQSLCCGQ
uniref:Uncharacterized protein n=1 Tax=Anguilla anguilla TaxID=7936 RepID=A0A0E9SAU1_ANGAN